MFGKVKKWLGIEGVKLELELPEKVEANAGLVQGKIRFYSMNPQVVTTIKVVMIERYSRGRRKEKMTDEYQLGEITLRQDVEVPVETPVEIDFSLPFSMLESDIDEFGNKNVLFKGLAGVAKRLNAVQSVYRVEAEAKVKGTALSPFDRKEVVLV
jgi:hypothetical protein